MKILTAHYGTGLENDVSVLEAVNRYPKDGLAIPVSNDVLGCDPAFGDPNKRLEVEYSYDGTRPVKVSRREGTRLLLPEDSWLKGENNRLRTEADKLLREVDRLKSALSSPATAIDEGRAILLKNAPRLWVQYKAATKNPTQMEALVFSKDGNSPVRNIQVGPLTWNVAETRPISLHNVIGVLRSEPIECRFTALEQVGNTQHVFELPELMREMMRKFDITAQPLVDVSYDDMDGTAFTQTFILSIDPYNRIVWEPIGSLRLKQSQ